MTDRDRLASVDFEQHPGPTVSVDRSTVRQAVLVVGTRPEAVKLAPIALALAGDSGWEPSVVSTGQHGAVVDEVLTAFAIEADRRYEPWKHDGDLASLHTVLVGRLHTYLRFRRAAAVIVQGDTSSALAGALAAFWLQLPVVHVEAGLRSGDLSAPFPEEANRRLISQLTSLHLAPTAGAEAALLTVGIARNQIVVTGNTVIDALRSIQGVDHEPFVPSNSGFRDVPATPRRRTVLVTCHRRENWGKPMARVADALHLLAAAHRDVDFMVIAHPNPAIQALFVGRLGQLDNVTISGPLGYLPFVSLLADATLVITDSGGVQEEAPALAVPVLVLRRVTERPEAVTAGVARMVGTDTDSIVRAADRLLSDRGAHQAMARAVNPFGDGHAARRSVAAMNWYFRGLPRPDSFVT